MEKEILKKVYVGLSGGVDSSVSAALLMAQGYEVTGVFIKAWYPDFLNCNWKEEKRDVMRICAHLDIPFKMLDLSKEYKKGVIDYLIEEYREGRTPNPDVLCNKKIKFGSFFNWAIKNGADFVATGHYAQILKKGKEYLILKSVDSDKDQTYFLWTLKQKHLSKILFPIGHLKKKEVRQLAKKFGLFTSTKKDSQGLCFLGNLDMKEFLKKYFKTNLGNVLNTEGEIIGKHQGSELYTIGQRQGFTIFNKSPNTRAFFVISKNLKNNTLIVSEEKPTIKKEDNLIIKLSNVNINTTIKKSPIDIDVSFRYRQVLNKALLNIKEKTLKIKDNSEIATPGQSAVFYVKNQCIGGGIIET